MVRFYSFFFRILLVLTCLAFLGACAGMKKTPVLPGMPDPENIVEQIKHNVTSLEDFKGISRFTHVNDGQMQSGRIAFAVSLPDKLRVEMLGPFGQPLISLASNGSKLYLYIRSKDLFKSGIQFRSTLKKILGMPISIPELNAILAGYVPVADYYRAQIKPWSITRNGPNSGWELSLKSRFGRIKEKIWLGLDKKTVIKATLYSSSGDELYTVFPLDNPNKADTIRVLGPEGASITLEPQKFWENTHVDKTQFIIKRPRKNAAKNKTKE